EQVSEETGCWLYIVAHLPHSRLHFANYTSSCLSNEGPSTLNEIHQLSNKMFASLQCARRVDAAELVASLQNSQSAITILEAERDALLKEQEQKSDESRRLQQENAYKDMLIRQFQEAQARAPQTSETE
ncbi:hypothetical protein BT96DRAFT_841070, partial [Gymnopus androsaceus JB14]